MLSQEQLGTEPSRVEMTAEKYFIPDKYTNCGGQTVCVLMEKLTNRKMEWIINVSEYAVICLLILTALHVCSWSDNIFTTATMFKTLTVDTSLFDV